MTGNRARTRAIRARMATTGEPYTLAARNHDAERATPTAPERIVCECRHDPDAHPDDKCTGLDSYGTPCECPGYVEMDDE